MNKNLRFAVAIKYLDTLEKKVVNNSQRMIDIVPFSRMLMIFEKGKNIKAFVRATSLYIEFCKKNKISNEKETLSYLAGTYKKLGLEYLFSMLN